MPYPLKPGWWDELQIERVWSERNGKVIVGWRWVNKLSVIHELTYKCSDSVVVAGEINETSGNNSKS